MTAPKLPKLAMPKLPRSPGPKVERPVEDEGPTIEEMVDGLAEDNLTEGQMYFREQRQNERANFQLNTDSEYWCCLVFETREQKDAFLRHFQAARVAGGDKYLNGVAMAKALGVDIGGPTVFPRIKPPTRKLVGLAMGLPRKGTR